MDTVTYWFHTSLIYGFICDWLPNMSYTYLYRDLSFNNKLSSIPDGAFSGLKQLEVLWEKIYFKTYNLFVNRIREMVSFKLGKEVQKDLLRLFSCHETGTKKKFWVPMGFDSSWGLRIFICPRLVKTRKTSYSIQPAFIKTYLVTLKHAN